MVRTVVVRLLVADDAPKRCLRRTHAHTLHRSIQNCNETLNAHTGCWNVPAGTRGAMAQLHHGCNFKHRPDFAVGWERLAQSVRLRARLTALPIDAVVRTRK